MPTRRLASNLKNVTYKQRSEKYYNSKVKIRQFKIGDLVLKKLQAQHKTPLGPKWEGPFRISKWLSNGVYELEHLDGIPDQYPWNACHLKKYYQ
ncbi:hypothetical protein ACS0TY_022056 [Phlomoides rotata]